MAIRDRIRRALRKSDSSDTISQTGSNTTTATATTAATSDTSSLHKLPTTASALSRIFTLGSRSKDSDGHASSSSSGGGGGGGGGSSSSSSAAKERTERKERKERRERTRTRGKTVMHTSQRPLTLQNLEHQEMLSHFMTFGASDPGQVVSPSSYGVSPCCTRPASVVLDGADDYFARAAASSRT